MKRRTSDLGIYETSEHKNGGIVFSKNKLQSPNMWLNYKTIKASDDGMKNNTNVISTK